METNATHETYRRQGNTEAANENVHTKESGSCLNATDRKIYSQFIGLLHIIFLYARASK